MKALRYLNPNVLKTEEIDPPECNQGEAVLRVHAAGICGTDMAILAGKHPRAEPPLVMGHEFAGEIVEMLPVDADSDLTVGDKVTAYPLLVCGNCWACRSGFSHVCRDLKLIGIDQDGAFAEYVKVPLDLLLKVPDTLTFDQGALIEPLAVGVHAIAMAQKPDWQTAIVMGCGPIGLIVAWCLQYTGIETILVSDINSHRLKRAQKLNLQVFNSTEGNLGDRVADLTNAEGADILFECAGSDSSAMQMCDLVRPRGKIIMVSVHKDPHAVDLRAISFKEITMIGTRVYTRDDYRKALEMIVDFPYKDLISHNVSLEKGPDGFDLMGNPDDVCKVLIKME